MILNDFFENVPNNGLLLLHHFLGLLNGSDVTGLFEPVINKWLEQLQRHLLGQSTLVQLELWADHDDGTSGVIHALAEQVLTEASLLALERVGERLQRTIVSAS